MSISLPLQFFYNCLDADAKASSKQMINTIIEAISHNPFMAAALFNQDERDNLQNLSTNGSFIIEDSQCHPGYELFANIRNKKATLNPYTKDKLAELVVNLKNCDKELKAFDKASTLILGIIRCYGFTYADTAIDNLCNYYDEQVKLDVSLNILSLLVHQQISATIHNNNQLLSDPTLDNLTPEDIPLDEQKPLPYDFDYIMSMGENHFPLADQSIIDLLIYVNELNNIHHEMLFNDSIFDTIYCSAHCHVPFINLCNMIIPTLSIEEEQTLMDKLKIAYENMPCALSAGLSYKACDDDNGEFIFDENFPLLSNLLTYLAQNHVAVSSHEDLLYEGSLYIQAHPEVVDAFLTTVIIDDDSVLNTIENYRKIVAGNFKVVSLQEQLSGNDSQLVITLQDENGKLYSTPIFDDELVDCSPALIENNETINCILLPLLNDVADYICLWHH